MVFVKTLIKKPFLIRSIKKMSISISTTVVQYLKRQIMHLFPLRRNTVAAEFDEGDVALFSFQKILQNFSDSLSHRIFRRMHKVLNIDKNKN